MTTLKQILCAIINFGHPYDVVEKAKVINFYGFKAYEVPNSLKCSCGKVFESKAVR